MEKEKQPIRILQVLRGGPICGGIENFVMNYYRHIDRERVQFDFLVHSKEKGYYDDEIKALGGRIYYLSLLDDKNVLKYIVDLFRFFRAHREYRIVHGQVRGFAPVYFTVAALCGVPGRISHSHASGVEPTMMGRVLDLMVRSIKFPSNVHWACSKQAGEYMYGGKAAFEVIPNAISTQRFCPDEVRRRAVREELGISGRFVVGNIGRFCLQKNQKFLLRIFKEVLQLRTEAVLLLIGEGKLEAELREEARRLDLEQFVLFVGTKSAIEDYYRAMDVFVLPSVFEGFPMVLVEAQACGVPCAASTEVTTEINLSGDVLFLPLRSSPRVWAEAVVEAEMGRDAVMLLRQHGYDIQQAAAALTAAYETMMDRFAG
ncbi:glycosyltransferase family 1 protein [Oscillospiraceae bacterium 44-5]